MQLQFFFFFFGLMSVTTDAKLRGVNNIDDLKERLSNPVVRSELRGGTVGELGVVKGTTEIPDKMTEKKGSDQQRARKRSLEGSSGQTLQFFSVRALWKYPPDRCFTLFSHLTYTDFMLLSTCRFTMSLVHLL